MVTEAYEWCNEIVTRETAAWEKGPLAEGLRPVFASGKKEISEQLDDIGETLAELHFKLGLTGGLKSDDVSVVSAGERGWSIAIDLVFNPANVLAGGGGGILSSLGGAAAATAVFWALPLLGASILALPVALVVGPVVSLLMAGPGLEQRVKKQVLAKADQWLVDASAKAQVASGQGGGRGDGQNRGERPGLRGPQDQGRSAKTSRKSCESTSRTGQ